MFSVVIPTLGMSPFTLQILLRILKGADLVKEVFLINNSGTAIEVPSHPKFKQQILPENIFVNPSWNLGASLAAPTAEWLVFLNDDILIPANTFDCLAAAPLSRYSLIGVMAESIARLSRHDDYLQSSILLSDAISGRTWGFGIFMLVKRPDFIAIPNELKIWCGDDFLVDEMSLRGKRVGVMDLHVRTHMSTTSDRPEFRQMREEDRVAYGRMRNCAEKERSQAM